MFYTISLFMTILSVFFTSTVEGMCQFRALHSTCSPCHQNSHCLIRTCTKNRPEYNWKISMTGPCPDSTLDRHNIVFGIRDGPITFESNRYHYIAISTLPLPLHTFWKFNHYHYHYFGNVIITIRVRFHEQCFFAKFGSSKKKYVGVNWSMWQCLI